MLIMPQPNEEKTQVRIRVSDTILKEVDAYCAWAGIKYRDYFIEQACNFIFNSDNDWQEFKAKEQQD